MNQVGDMKKPEITQQRSNRWWQRLIEKQSESGESITRLCERHGISRHVFYYRRQCQQKQRSSKPKFTEVAVSLINECEVRCRNGRSVIIRGSVSPSALTNIMLAVEGDRQ